MRYKKRRKRRKHGKSVENQNKHMLEQVGLVATPQDT
jgi:hypothetical protein